MKRCALLASLLITSLQSFAALPEEILTSSGTLSGTLSGTRSGTRSDTISDTPAANNNSVKVFKGIPYAAAPTGENRWRAPQAPASWSGVRSTKEKLMSYS